MTLSDRIAAARMAVLPELRELILAGRCDDCPQVEIARDIRIAEQERLIALIESDATVCDCHARDEGECACGAWCEWKTITSARAVAILREDAHND